MGIFEDPPKARNTDPSTSHHAKAIHLNEDRVEVLHVHVRHPHGLTDYELASIMARQFNSVNVRRGELRDEGWIIDTGFRRPAPSGSSCIVWQITPEGIAKYEELELFGWEFVHGRPRRRQS